MIRDCLEFSYEDFLRLDSLIKFYACDTVVTVTKENTRDLRKLHSIKNYVQKKVLVCKKRKQAKTRTAQKFPNFQYRLNFESIEQCNLALNSYKNVIKHDYT